MDPGKSVISGFHGASNQFVVAGFKPKQGSIMI
eukprot:SAG22_NODE_17456_length_304_cov_1.097561_1_plen_32_part_10